MAIDRLKKNIAWLRKTLEIIDRTTLPGTIVGEIRPVLDALGWDLIQETERAATTAGGSTQVARLPPVDAGEAHLFLSCSTNHDESAVSHILNLNYRDPDGTESGVSDGAAVIDEVPVVLKRPFLVLAGARLTAFSADAIPVASNLFIRGHFIRLDIGEYIPGSPWG